MRRWAPVQCAVLLVASACTFGIQIEPPPPPPPEIPVPAPYAAPVEGSTRAAVEIRLEPSQYSGLARAPDIDPLLFFSRSDKLWYRYWRGRWYQAFRWNGYWFPPAELPETLAAGDPPKGAERERESRRAADERTRDMPRDEQGLPTLPEFLDPGGGEDDPNASDPAD